MKGMLTIRLKNDAVDMVKKKNKTLKPKMKREMTIKLYAPFMCLKLSFCRFSFVDCIMLKIGR